jgi:hypothetical protein
MELEEVQKDTKKDVILTIRTTRKNSKWMKDYNVSPSLLFEKALEELIEKTKKEEKEDLKEIDRNINRFVRGQR